MRLYEIQQNIQTYSVDEETLEEAGFDYYEILNQAENLIKQCGMNMLRDDEITNVAVSGDQVVGVLYYALRGSELAWSIAVNQQYRSKGVASRLYNEMYIPDEVETLKAELISPYTLENFVIQKGYVKVAEEGGFKVYQRDL
jgi:GNAT superfamily N-acetyltransferase